ncbi:MAG: hypothetical protein MMC23_002973 [Stictis urceolatum]|nr:hypothetical protein [Stictis urceolata]
MSPSQTIKTIPRGASLQSLPINGQNITLSFPHPSLYSTHPHPHFGETIGRTTNRIAHAQIKNLNGRDYQLFANNGPNNLHGGKVGWGAREWTGPFFVRRGRWDKGIVGVRPDGFDMGAGKRGDGDKETGDQGEGREGWGYSIESEDGEEGFPGAVKAWAWYFEGRGEKGEVVLDIEYEIRWKEGYEGEATETVIGITNHAYFNLNLAQSTPATLADHTATISTPTHQTLRPDLPGIPTGTLTPHPEVPSSPNTPFPLSTPSGSIRPIDDCFILNSTPSSIPLDTRPLELQTLATLHGDKSGLNLRVESTEPAFQFYTGITVDVPAWDAGEGRDGGQGFGGGSGVCVEPSRYVNAAGSEEWRGMCLLKRAGVFGARSRYWGWKD